MATPRSTTGGAGTQTAGGGSDIAESAINTLEQTTKQTTGVSLMHVLTFGSIAASLALFFAGKKNAAIFVGLWPPTFQALKSVIDEKKRTR
jgi:hypothetical protein